jgi:hypothetical protein
VDDHIEGVNKGKGKFIFAVDIQKGKVTVLDSPLKKRI